MKPLDRVHNPELRYSISLIKQIVIVNNQSVRFLSLFEYSPQSQCQNVKHY